MRLLGILPHVHDCSEKLQGCPRCLRQLLWSRTWANLLGANVLFPVVAYFNGVEYVKVGREQRLAEAVQRGELTEAERGALDARWRQKETLVGIVVVVTFALLLISVVWLFERLTGVALR